MEKFVKLLACLLVTGMFSCSREKDPVTVESAKIDHTAVDTVPVIAGTNNLEALLPQLPLLKFPLTLGVEDSKKQNAFPVSFDPKSPWFTNSADHATGKKVNAIGKFYVDFNTAAVVFRVTDNAKPGDEELLLSLFNVETGEVNSRVVAIAETKTSGSTRMRTPNKGKSVVRKESAEIQLSFVDFAIKNGKFVEGKPEHKTFPGDQKGSDQAESFLKKRMK